jgi:hypothetical protein
VIVITYELPILVQNHAMEHRGIRYAVQLGIARGQWRVAIYLPGDGSPKEKTVSGRHTKVTARSMINSWLKKQRTALKKTKE